MFTESPALDRIETDDESYTGIVDYVNTKHVVFYNTTNLDDPDIILVVISWKMTYPDMRFSVFKDIFFPTVKIPVVLIPKKCIKGGITKDQLKSHKQKQYRRPLTRQSDSSPDSD